MEAAEPRDRAPGWWARMCAHEAVAALHKAVRAARRYPAGSPLRRASAAELAAAVRKALQHGPLRVRVTPEGPTLPGDPPRCATPPGRDAVDLVIRDVDPQTLEGIVATQARAALDGDRPKG